MATTNIEQGEVWLLMITVVRKKNIKAFVIIAYQFLCYHTLLLCKIDFSL